MEMNEKIEEKMEEKMKEKKIVIKVCMGSAMAVALFTVLFIVALVCTFDFSEWKGLDNYVAKFKPIQMLTVIPSILLAISYVIFVSGLHIITAEYRKLWSLLSLNFGLLYSGISISNYLIQLITVIPSIQNGITDGLTIFVSGYSNSIFFALMASYFLQCVSLCFAAFTFAKNENEFKWVRRFFACSGLAIPLFLIGAIINIPFVMMLGALSWILGVTVGMIMFVIGLKKSNFSSSLKVN